MIAALLLVLEVAAKERFLPAGEAAWGLDWEAEGVLPALRLDFLVGGLCTMGGMAVAALLTAVRADALEAGVPATRK
jgi:hypothetical protein